jgi:uncharacterized protein (DUF1697 family)
MRRRYVVLLRAISNVGMQSFREAMTRLGLTDVESYGMSGNLLFTADDADTALLERRIAAEFGTAAFVRTRSELAKIVHQDPYSSTIVFLAHAPAPAARRAFLQLDFETPRPVLRGRTLFYVYPGTLRGKRTPLDFERVLSVQDTFRSARVVTQLLARLRK